MRCRLVISHLSFNLIAIVRFVAKVGVLGNFCFKDKIVRIYNCVRTTTKIRVV